MKSKIFDILDKLDIRYAIIEGDKYIDELCHDINLVKPDLDIVIESLNKDILQILDSDSNYERLDYCSFREIDIDLRIDLYFNSINVGYYYYLKIKEFSFVNKKIDKNEYLIYLLLDPLLKFGEYKQRHQCKIRHYLKDFDSKDFMQLIRSIIGKKIADDLLLRLRYYNFHLDINFIKSCKLKLLLINGNFVRMIQNRFF